MTIDTLIKNYKKPLLIGLAAASIIGSVASTYYAKQEVVQEPQEYHFGYDWLLLLMLLIPEIRIKSFLTSKPIMSSRLN